MAKYLDIIIIASLVCAANAENKLYAKFYMGGVTGKVTFTQETPGQAVTLNIDLRGLQDGVQYTLEVHEFRVNFETKQICSSNKLGMTKNSLGTTTTTSGKAQLTVSGIDLWGINSVEGRSFVMRSSSWVVCATIEADTEYITAFANFPKTIGGPVIFRQQRNYETSSTTVDLNLYFLDQIKPQNALKWQITSGNVDSDVSKRCDGAGDSMYNPYSSSEAGCTATDHASCKIGDLSSKLGNITIPTSGNTRIFLRDLNLPLSGKNSIIGKTIVFINGNENYACATIMQYPRMGAFAKFSNDGVTGKVTFDQMSPFDPVSISVNLQNLTERAGGYHVHEWPKPQRILNYESVCSSGNIGGHFNPLGVPTDIYPSPASTTPDKYEVGDISGKFGLLADKNNYVRSMTDPNMQLFGRNTIMGRSIVIHKTGGARWICAPIKQASYTPMTTAYARFTFPVIGHIVLRQPENMPYAETLVYVELDNAVSLSTTENHAWHVHESPVTGDMLSETGRCTSAGGHYNPFSVYLSGDYSIMCNTMYQFRCEVGDLAGKHGKLNIRSLSGKKTKYFFSDMQLPLSGPQSVVGKSIVIHDENSGAKRLACANIVPKVMRKARVSAWSSAAGQGSPTGYISFAQNGIEVSTGYTDVKVDLSGLNSAVAGYHIHEYPTHVNTPTPQVCQSSDVGGHFNPFGAPFPGPISGTQDMYEVGDMSGKFDPLSGDAYMRNISDLTLAMDGLQSIVGRSIVLHENKEGAPRWACGNIVDVTPNSKLVQQKAVFEGDIQGYIMLSQVRYDNGDNSNTMVLVNLYYSDDKTKITTGHKWHVHEKRKNTDCGSTGPHYNPYMVNVDSGYDECSMYNPLRCEMGDQSGKLGTYDIGAGKRFYTDATLMLWGIHSAAKRSIVIHDEGGKGGRIACANLMPYGSSVSMAYLNFTKKPFEIEHLEKKVAEFLGTIPENVLAVANTDDKCVNSVLYFLGESGEMLKDQFAEKAKNQPSGLEKYAPDSGCPYVSGSGVISMSLITVAACLLLSILRP